MGLAHAGCGPVPHATRLPAARAYPAWRDTPVPQRIQLMLRFKALLDEHLDELAQTAPPAPDVPVAASPVPMQCR